ncbi:unnamed protein product [Protopolystoma xenopodis]|uniref:Uncharacterized protein n=1 Tax=Protopolystoma xenopodis TaxID=117903 RepID=A0A448XPF0_9PLAT|nr:unnamed protein product [Protopolystoma xenopodis]
MSQSKGSTLNSNWQGYPRVVYDLLPRQQKNASFIVLFDMASAMPRFLLAHRAVRQHYHELTYEERLDLVRAATAMVEHGGFTSASLSLPLVPTKSGSSSPSASADREAPATRRRGGLGRLIGVARYPPLETFTAILTVPEIYQFMEVYKRNYSSIPLWPSHRWVTEFWTVSKDSTADIKDYPRSVLAAQTHQEWLTPEMVLPRSTPIRRVYSSKGRRMRTRPSVRRH